DLKRDVLVLQLRLQLNEELIDDALDHFVTQATKLDNGIQTVSEFRRKALLDHFHRIGRVVLMRKANRSSCCRFRSGIGGHDKNDVAEIRLAPVVVGQRAMVHDLQQQVEDFRMRLLNFIEQEHAVRLLGDRLSQQAALVEPNI